MTNNIPYMRKDISTLITLSAAILLLLLASPVLPLSHFLLQPVQASTLPTSLQTPNPVAIGTVCSSDANAQLTFDAKDNGNGDLTSGTFQISDSSTGQILWSGKLYSASIGSDSSDNEVDLVYSVDNNSIVCNAGSQLWVTTYCTQAPPNPNIILETDAGSMGGVNGAVDCDGAGDTTAQSTSSPMTGTTSTQDSDGDGIPDSSDRCASNSNQRCYKESK
jgi:hypothetical protein